MHLNIYFFKKDNKAGSVKYFLGGMETWNETLYLVHTLPVVQIFGLTWPHLSQLEDLIAELLDDSL